MLEFLGNVSSLDDDAISTLLVEDHNLFTELERFIEGRTCDRALCICANVIAVKDAELAIQLIDRLYQDL